MLPSEIAIANLNDPNNSKLVVSRGVIYIITTRESKQVILIKNYLDDGVIPIGVAKDYNHALRYVATLDNNYLEQVA